jgi:hypothetical protein
MQIPKKIMNIDEVNSNPPDRVMERLATLQTRTSSVISVISPRGGERVHSGAPARRHSRHRRRVWNRGGAARALRHGRPCRNNFVRIHQTLKVTPASRWRHGHALGNV